MGFQTLAMSSRNESVSGTDHDRLRQSFDQLQRDKDRMEDQLGEARLELETLKNS